MFGHTKEEIEAICAAHVQRVLRDIKKEFLELTTEAVHKGESVISLAEKFNSKVDEHDKWMADSVARLDAHIARDDAVTTEFRKRASIHHEATEELFKEQNEIFKDIAISLEKLAKHIKPKTKKKRTK